MTRTALLGLALLAATPPTGLRADEKLKGIACRSVHLRYQAGRGSAFYNEVRIDESAPGTYVMACGWDDGYFGLQELADGRKQILFSVWDSYQNDPKAVDEDRRTKLVAKDPRIRIGRFGGEGTGGQSFFEYDWKLGETYRLMVTSRVAGDRIEYSGHFYLPEEKEWCRLVTFSTPSRRKDLGGYYSFVEDFKRDRVSATKVRKAHFGNGWISADDGRSIPLTSARFTADANPVLNIDAGADGGRFFLATGGETKNIGTTLGATTRLPEVEGRTPPERLPRAGGTTR